MAFGRLVAILSRIECLFTAQSAVRRMPLILASNVNARHVLVGSSWSQHSPDYWFLAAFLPFSSSPFFYLEGAQLLAYCDRPCAFALIVRPSSCMIATCLVRRHHSWAGVPRKLPRLVISYALIPKRHPIAVLPRYHPRCYCPPHVQFD